MGDRTAAEKRAADGKDIGDCGWDALSSGLAARKPASFLTSSAKVFSGPFHHRPILIQIRSFSSHVFLYICFI
jgi:hypothetical protein